MVRGERRNPAPIVDSRAQNQVVLIIHKVRRRLYPRAGSQHQPGHRDRGCEVCQFCVRYVAHPGVRLCAEVLHDDFLDAAILAGYPADGEDRVCAFRLGLADADEDARGERDTAAARILEYSYPDRRILVRASEMRETALGEQPLRRGFEHHAHRRSGRRLILVLGNAHGRTLRVRPATTTGQGLPVTRVPYGGTPRCRRLSTGISSASAPLDATRISSG